MELQLIDPTGITSRGKSHPAPRVPTLDGTVIGLLDNGKHNAKEIIGGVAELLESRYAIRTTVWHHKNYVTFPSGSQPAPPEMLDDLADRCDCVIIGVGD